MDVFLKILQDALLMIFSQPVASWFTDLVNSIFGIGATP